VAIKEFFLGKKSLKAAGNRNVDSVVDSAEKGKTKPAPKKPAAKVPAKKPVRKPR
jgi:hypothetical protein